MAMPEPIKKPAFMPSCRATPRVRAVKIVLWFLAGLAATAIAARYVRGLGYITDLSDRTPWGLRKGFNVFGGVALAAGGFVIAAAVNILRLKKYRPILRPAVLTAFLGYASVVVALFIDIGASWNIWRPALYWQPGSILFEIAWCVMLYFTVLAFELAPVVLERTRFGLLLGILKYLTVPLVILGVMLSTLHQSSLGGLFLIMPFRLHPLWYSPHLPLLFFVSSVGLGLAVVSLGSLLTSWLYCRRPQLELLEGLARALAMVLGLYVIIVPAGLALQGKLHYLAQPTWETFLFLVELSISAVLPAVLLAAAAVRRSRAGIAVSAIMVIAGFVLNRINVSGIATITATGSDYFPSLAEIAIALGIAAAAGLAYFFFVERFHVYAPEPECEGAGPEPLRKGGRALYALAFFAAAAASFLLLPGEPMGKAVEKTTPIKPVKTVAAFKGADDARDVMLINGDRNDWFVPFDHAGHKAYADSCASCHHMKKPFAGTTSCGRCHTDMQLQTNIFNHDLHVEALGGEEMCTECHADPALPKTAQNTPPCLSCHDDLVKEGSMIDAPPGKWPHAAPGYMNAMHGLCLACHDMEKKACDTCHVSSDQP
ncbi:MAG: NrfD/PsrC family molybdoenzyme membrane anchor subunit [Pseudomonadota bacterium]